MAVRVLLCDDHTVFTDGLRAVLDCDELQVVGTVATAAGLEEAIERARPDVVLMDHQLPDGDGVSLTRQLADSHPEVRVVILTSATDEAVLIGALQAGATGFVTKHESATKVAEAAIAAAQGRVVVSSEVLSHLLPRAPALPAEESRTLTSRELEVLELMGDGASSAEIGTRLFISRNTVRSHVQAVLNKLGAHTRLEAVVIATKSGLIRSR
jgi:DNA-binding NarL/FixJ family response regulator